MLWLMVSAIYLRKTSLPIGGDESSSEILCQGQIMWVALAVINPIGTGPKINVSFFFVASRKIAYKTYYQNSSSP